MRKGLGPVMKMTLAAMLIVIDILGTRLPGYLQPTALFGFNRISLGPSIVIFASLALGPFYGAVVGAGGDALGWLLLGTQTGPLNFFITIIYGLLGVLPWLLLKLSDHFRILFNKPFILYGLLAILWGVYVGFLFGSNVFDETFIRWNMNVLIAKWVFFGVSLVLAVGTVLGLQASGSYFKKRFSGDNDIPSPYQVGFIVLISEVVLMVFLKPLAFYCDFLIFFNTTLEYGILVLLAIMFSFADIPLASFLVSWLLMFSQRFLHSYGYEENKGNLNEKAKVERKLPHEEGSDTRTSDR